jgi:hypothetical protein
MSVTTSTPNASVPTSIRIPAKLRQAIRRAALQDSRTQSAQMVWLMQQGLAARMRQLEQQERTP